jgi:glycosyltransferase involved in cell wall biosynthesis
MIEGRTILCFASGYDAPPTSKHHVMHLLAERNVVLWVNYHASRTPTTSSSDVAYMARKLREVGSGLRRVRPNLYTLTPLVLPLPGQAVARRLNRLLVVAQVRAALAKLPPRPLQVWSFTPDVSYVLDYLGAERVLYYCVDDFASFSGYDAAQVRADEADLARRADLVVTTSQALQDAKAPLNPNTILVPHGVDYEHFSRAVREDLPVPEDMQCIPHPILGFFGLIRDWVDLDLLAEVARRRPQWHIVLIGDADSNVDLAAYRDIPNMHFLGRRPYADLPAYCRCFDVGLIPFKVNELTRSVNPIKLREYLAAGLPVVSTPLPEVVAQGERIRIADSPEAAVSVVETCLAERSGPEARCARSEAMAEEAWDRKLTRISDFLASASRPEGGRRRKARRPKVLIGIGGGGFAIQAIRLLQSQPSGVDVLLAVPAGLSGKLAEMPGVRREALRLASPHTRQKRSTGLVASALAVPVGLAWALRFLRKERPDAVIGVAQRLAIYMLLAARLLGIRTVFVECVTRVTRPALTGRVVSALHLADRFYVQWPEARRLYRGAVYAGRLV